MERLQEQLVAVLKARLTGGDAALPEAGAVFWKIFADLSATRTYHAAGANPISHAEIEAYARLHRWPLEPRHVAIIRALDDAWLDYARQSIGGQQQPRRSSGQAINPAAFDAVFG